MVVKKEKIKKAIKELLKAIGEDPTRKELLRTPERAADVFESIISGKSKDIKEILKVTHGIKHDEMVLIKDIPFYSICEHHLLPFFGKCCIAYIPEGNRVLGISRLIEAVDVISKKLQIQERLTSEIANAIMKNLKPKGVGVVIEARHLCIEMRYIKIPEKVITSAVRGIFRKDIKTREEFLRLIR